MRKHVLVLAVIAFGVYYFGFRSMELDLLLKPVPVKSAESVGERFVDPDYSRRPIDDRDFAENGHITVVYYHLTTCPGCQKLDADLKELRRLRPDVAVRKIALAMDWSTEGMLRDFRREVGQTPFVVIYGPNRKIVAADKGRNEKAFGLLYAWINAELKREWERKNKSG
jgi:hypothetical protein